METVSDFIFLGSKINGNRDCSHEIKRQLLLGRIAMTNLDRVLKRGEITLPKKVHIVKAIVFTVVMHECESWTINKAEHWRTDAFELWCWRLLRVPWTSGRSNQSVLKDISPEYSLEELVLKLKLQYFGHLMWRADSLEKTLRRDSLRAREGDNRERDGWHHQFNGHDFQQTPGHSEGQGRLAVHQGAKSQTWLNDWKTSMPSTYSSC